MANASALRLEVEIEVECSSQECIAATHDDDDGGIDHNVVEP